jgi:RecA/RadA recombinase
LPPNTSETLARRLVVRAHAVSEEAARLLLAAEYLTATQRRSLPPPTAKMLLELADRRQPASGGRDESAAFDENEPARSRLRLASLVLEAWDRETAAGVESRPDVLAITCDFLANPREPSTHAIVQFCLTLALRALYGSRYTRESMTKLRRSFERVRNAAATGPDRWHFRPEDGIDDLVIDLLCMNGTLQRALRAEARAAFYDSFRLRFFGVDRGTGRRIPGGDAGLSLRGRPLEYGALLNLAFNQPSGIPGFDEVTGGLLSPVLEHDAGLSGGLISLVAGPPGSGKTSLSLAMASRMAELGSHVRYITMEEPPATLEAKLDIVAGKLAGSLSATLGEIAEEPPMAGEVRPRLFVIDGKAFGTLADLVAQLKQEFAVLRRAELLSERSARFSLFLVFPRVVVVDSVTALIQRQDDTARTHGAQATTRTIRRELNEALNSLRELGVCVVLIGTKEHAHDESLAYLVDNVFSLDLDAKVSYSHPVRTFHVEKTRLQASGRGRHVLHLGGASGCSISPSLHNVLTQLNRRRVWSPSESLGAVFRFSKQPPGASQTTTTNSDLVLRARSQILVFGYGSAGKARLALALALQPRIPIDAPPVVQREAGVDAVERSRVLVVSFLYEDAYYRDLAEELYEKRFNVSGGSERVDVIAFYPGMLAAETAVAAITARMRTAELWGRPYRAVLIDGVHNIMMQFPLLDHEPLLWPALYRLLRTKGVEAVTTFTFFKMAGGQEAFRPNAGAPSHFPSSNSVTASPVGHLGVSQELYFHLLLSSCDYTFRIDQPEARDSRVSLADVTVRLVQALDASVTDTVFEWEPATFTMKEAHSPLTEARRGLGE